MRHAKLKAIDLFAGIGGMRIGLERAGFDFIYANDFDKYACETYRYNLGEIDERDIKDIDTNTIPDFDILVGGFPCQPFSMIGKRKGMDDERAKSFFHIVKILISKKPAAFLLENVKHLRLYEDGKVYERIKANLEWAGYKVRESIMDSQRFGVPQHRERLYVVGFLNHSVNFEFPDKPWKLSPLSSILESNVDEFYYLSERYYQTLIKHKKRHRTRGNGFGFAILDPSSVSNTVVAGNMGRERNLVRDKKNKKNKWGIRKLTVRECARLQGFPDNFHFPVSRTRAYHQIGNAVTVNVAHAIGSSIKKHLNQTKKSKTLSSPSAFNHFSASELHKTSAT